jgi:hypothetical protein
VTREDSIHFASLQSQKLSRVQETTLFLISPLTSTLLVINVLVIPTLVDVHTIPPALQSYISSGACFILLRPLITTESYDRGDLQDITLFMSPAIQLPSKPCHTKFAPCHNCLLVEASLVQISIISGLSQALSTTKRIHSTSP